MYNYIRAMPNSTQVLWCYVIWYVVMVLYYFDSNLALWSNSLGISIIVGVALVLATAPITVVRFRQQFWQVARLFLCPFCVSSFSALTKGKGFWLILSSEPDENLVALILCGIFCIIVFIIKRSNTNG